MEKDWPLKGICFTKINEETEGRSMNWGKGKHKQQKREEREGLSGDVKNGQASDLGLGHFHSWAYKLGKLKISKTQAPQSLGLLC